MRVVASRGELELVAAESGARSTPSVIALSATGEWLVGDAAAAQAGKNARATVTDVLALLPREEDDDDGDALRLRLSARRQESLKVLTLEEVKKRKKRDDDDAPAVLLAPTGSGDTTLLTAQVAASKLFASLKKIADESNDDDDDDVAACVVSVPIDVYDSPRALDILRAAARTAKVDVLQFIGDPYAAAIAHGLDDEDPKEEDDDEKDTTDEREAPLTVVAVVDVGGTRGSCAVFDRSQDGMFRFVKYVSKTNASCAAITAKLEAHCAEQFKRQHKLDVAEGGERARRKLRDACARAAKLLTSLNSQQADVEADALVDGIDCRVKVSNARFQDMCADVFRNLERLVDDALASLNSKDYADASLGLVLCGGGGKGSSVLKVVERSLDKWKKQQQRDFATTTATMTRSARVVSPLGRLEPEEAAAFGAARQASYVAFGTSPEDDEPAKKHKKKKVETPRFDALLGLHTGVPHSSRAVRCCLVDPTKGDVNVDTLPTHCAAKNLNKESHLLCPRFAPLPHSLERDIDDPSEGSTLFVAFVADDGGVGALPIAACDVAHLKTPSKKLHVRVDIAVDATLKLQVAEKEALPQDGPPQRRKNPPVVLVCGPDDDSDDD